MTEPPPQASAPAQPTPHPIHTVVIPASVAMVSLLGPRDELLRTIERQFPRVEINVRGNEFQMTGPSAEVALVERLLDELLVVIDAGQPLNRDAVERSIGMLRAQTAERPADVLTMNIVSNRGRTIRPKTLNQKRYVDAIDTHTIVFGIGPAGTGKTYLAMAKAVAALQAKQVNRIILTRPAVEAGERLGFLPGTLNDKIDPYLRPLYDALHDMVDPESIPRLMAAGTIEVAPLAYMRGRAQPYDRQVLTPTGFRPLGSLRVGDLVVGSRGRPTPVIGIHPQGLKEVFRVSTGDGAATLACAEHLWTIRDREAGRGGRWRTLETRELAGLLSTAPHRHLELPLVDPVEFEGQEVPLDPYAAGRLLGDRCGGRRGRGVDAPVRRREPAASGRVRLRLDEPAATCKPGTDFEADAVPEVYLHNSVATRLAMLQGLLDGDGAAVSGSASLARIRFTAASPRIRDDVRFLVRSLGGLASERPAGVLDIELPRGVRPFRVESKLAAYEAAGGPSPVRLIEVIEPAGIQDTMCIQVAAADSLYVTDDFLLTHNTLNDAFIILDEAQNTTPEQMKMFLTRLGFGSKIVVTGDVTQVDLQGGNLSGLRVVQGILDGIEDVHFINLTALDVVRHRLVGDIVEAYGRWDAVQNGRSPHPAGRPPAAAPRRRRTTAPAPAPAPAAAPDATQDEP